MSGGFYDYREYAITEVAESIENKIENNNVEPEYYFGEWKGQEYSDSVIEEFKKAYSILKVAELYAHRTDWLLSGDDGEESFIRRTREKFEDLIKTDKYGYVKKIFDALK